jgi:RsiW-degrading membrane proteinase PrsW (M82 family)
VNIFQRYIIAYIAGCLAALSIGMLVSRTGIATTIDAWFLTLTIASQDVGDRMMMLVKMFMAESITEQAISLSYLVGHSVLEEFIKFIAFYVVFRLTNPSSIREIVFTGMMVGVGFATVETFAFYSSTVFHLFLGFFIRTI